MTTDQVDGAADGAVHDEPGGVVHNAAPTKKSAKNEDDDTMVPMSSTIMPTLRTRNVDDDEVNDNVVDEADDVVDDEVEEDDDHVEYDADVDTAAECCVPDDEVRRKFEIYDRTMPNG